MQKTVEVPHVEVIDAGVVQFLDNVVDVPVGEQRQVFVETVQKTVEVPQFRLIEKGGSMSNLLVFPL